MKKYRLTFEFAETREQAQALCEKINANHTYYMRKNHPAKFTPWKASDGDSKYNFVVWYSV